MKLRNFFLAIAIVCSPWHDLQATLVTLSVGAGDNPLYSDAGLTTPLTAGPAGNGNGAIFQIGYFSSATTGNNFSGTFIAMTSDTGRLTTTIGDDNSEVFNFDGYFGLTRNFVVDDTLTGVMPSAGTPISIMFFDNTSVASSTAYNAVSNDAWIWPTPGSDATAPTLTTSLNDAGLEWLGGPSTAFYTALSIAPVPEVSTYGLISGLGLILFAGFQQRRRLMASAAGLFR